MPIPGDHEQYVEARRILLDALESLAPHLNALVIVGAQAVYFHAGEAVVAVAPYTKDADIALNPGHLAAAPTIETAMLEGGFSRTDQPGRWVKDRIPVDLMVPEALAGKGSRGADLGVHGRTVARRARGLEGALVDREIETIVALDGLDPRSYRIAIAGPGALLVAKLHKISERAGEPNRLQDKDALDVLRLLRAVPSDILVERFSVLMQNTLSQETAVEAVGILRDLFGKRTGFGALLAARALAPFEDSDTVAASCEALVDELMSAGLNVFTQE